eukprot:TRINITY_DN120_c0_g3_i1.p1 TRINITY_DN120_c0_g3~~TRINITY_DN120_c0_g3_i1.p1  ORF type:complete len:122 (-),score=13.56 TRINITY_DN120_c0_g3_i1:319-684(-)
MLLKVFRCHSAPPPEKTLPILLSSDRRGISFFQTNPPKRLREGWFLNALALRMRQVIQARYHAHKPRRLLDIRDQAFLALELLNNACQTVVALPVPQFAYTGEEFESSTISIAGQTCYTSR